MNADYLEIRQAYLAHYKTKGAKKGIRRFQSYEVAPNPSGYVGQEVGEAAAQSRRVGDDDNNAKKDGSDPKQTVEKLRSSLKQGRDEFIKKHPKVRLDQFDDDELIDLDIDDHEFRAEYGFDNSAAKDWKKMRDNERAVQKQIKELSPKKTTFADRLRSHYEKKYAKELEGKDKTAYDQIMDKAVNNTVKKIAGLTLATTGVIIAAANAPDLKKKLSSLKKD